MQAILLRIYCEISQNVFYWFLIDYNKITGRFIVFLRTNKKLRTFVRI